MAHTLPGPIFCEVEPYAGVELGWVFVLPSARQNGLSLRLTNTCIARAQGKLEVAQQSLDAALHLARTQGGVLNEAEILQARSALHCRVGNRACMREDALAAIAIFERLQAHHDKQVLSEWLERSESTLGV